MCTCPLSSHFSWLSLLWLQFPEQPDHHKVRSRFRLLELCNEWEILYIIAIHQPLHYTNLLPSYTVVEASRISHCHWYNNHKIKDYFTFLKAKADTIRSTTGNESETKSRCWCILDLEESYYSTLLDRDQSKFRIFYRSRIQLRIYLIKH